MLRCARTQRPVLRQDERSICGRDRERDGYGADRKNDAARTSAACTSESGFAAFRHRRTDTTPDAYLPPSVVLSVHTDSIATGSSG